MHSSLFQFNLRAGAFYIHNSVFNLSIQLTMRTSSCRETGPILHFSTHVSAADMSQHVFKVSQISLKEREQTSQGCFVFQHVNHYPISAQLMEAIACNQI